MSDHNHAESLPSEDFRTVSEAVNHPAFKPKVTAFASMDFSDVGFIRMKFEPGARFYPAVGFPALSHYKSPSRIGYEFGGKDVPVRDYLPGDLLLRPQETSSVADYKRTNDVCVLTLGPKSLRAIIDDPDADVEDKLQRISARPFRSLLLSELLNRLEAEAFNAAPSARPLYAETLLRAACLELWRLTSDDVETGRRRDQAEISARALQDIDDFIDQEGEETINIKSLAKIAKLPAAKFCRAFKNSLGKTPYQYVLDRRIARARCLVQGTSLSLAEIAFRCGFASQSHMTDAFRAKVGATPGALRKARA